MNTDADYSYAEPEAPLYAPASPSLHIPFALLSSAIAVVMIAQTVGTFKQKNALVDGKKALTEAYAKREPLVKQSGELKKKLNDMVVDLLILGKTDDDAKQIIGKYNIQQTQAGSAEVAAPAPAPAAP